MRFRRLTYHRSWFMIVTGAIALFSIVGGARSLRWSPVEDLAYLAVLGSAVAVLMIARGVTGAWSKRQLWVDIAGGKLKLPDGSLRDLDKLGALTIEKKALPRPRNIRVPVHDYLLRAANVEYYLFDSVYEEETKLRFDALEAAVLQYRLRRILERPTQEGSAFRAGPDPRAEILDLAGSPDRARAALELLTRDHDRSVRDQATSLRSSI